MACKNRKYINPTKVIDAWATSDCVVQLANADYYATKEWVDNKLEDIGGVTEDRVNELISDKTRPLSAKIDELSKNILSPQEIDERIDKKVSPLTARIEELTRNMLSKDELNSAIGNYAKVTNDTLLLNAENLK